MLFTLGTEANVEQNCSCIEGAWAMMLITTLCSVSSTLDMRKCAVSTTSALQLDVCISQQKCRVAIWTLSYLRTARLCALCSRPITARSSCCGSAQLQPSQEWHVGPQQGIHREA